MDETVTIISSQPPLVLQDSDVQMSLYNKEEISINNKGATEMVSHLVCDGFHVTLY